MRSRLQNLLQIHPGELLLAGLMAAVFFFWEAGREVGGQTAAALFISRIGPERLPYMYIGLGAGNVALSFLYSFALARFNARLIAASVPLSLATILLLEFSLIPNSTNSEVALTPAFLIIPAFWLTVNIGGGQLGTLAWGIAGQLLDARQARRLFSLFASAGLLGVITAATLAKLLSEVYRDNIARLVFWQVAFLAVGMVSVQWLLARNLRQQPSPASKSATPSARVGAETVMRSRLLSLVAVSLVLFSILYLTLDLIFNETVNQAFASEAQKLDYLASLNAVIQGATLLISLLITGRLVKRWGIVNMNFFLVGAYLAGFLLLMASGSLATVSLARFLQLATLGGIVQSSNYVFFNILPAERRSQAMSFTFGVIGQVGVILSGLLLLGNRLVPRPILLAAGLAITIATALVTFWMRRGYRLALVDALRAGRIEVFETGLPASAAHLSSADHTSRQFLVQSLSDANPLARRLAAEMLSEIGDDSAIPALTSCMADTDPGVRAATLIALHQLGSRSAPRWSLEALHDPFPEVVAVALRTLTADKEPLPAQALQTITQLLRSGELEIRLGAIRALALQGGIRKSRRALEVAFGNKDPFQRAGAAAIIPELIEALRAGGADPADLVSPSQLGRLLRDDSPLVRREACRAAGALRSPQLARRLIQLFADPVGSVREAAAHALSEYGDQTRPALLKILLSDKSEAESLESALVALGIQGQDLEELLSPYVQKEIDRLQTWRQRLGSLETPGRAVNLLKDFLRSEVIGCEIRLILALRALEPEDALEWDIVIRTLRSDDPSRRATILETLDTLGDTHTARTLILPALEVSSPGNGYSENETRLHPAAALRQLLDCGERWTQAFSMAAAAELHLDVLAPEISRFTRKRDPLLRETAQSALQRLKKGKVMARKSLQTLSSMERIILLREVPLFKTLEIHDLKRLAEIATEKSFARGDYLVQQGQAGDELFIIAAGEVEIWLNTGKKRERVSLGKAGDFFGEMAVLDSAPRSASIRAAGEVRALVLDGAAFNAILRDRPEVALTLLRGLTQRIRFANELLTPGKLHP